MSIQAIGYLVGIICTTLLLIPLIWGLIWQIKMHRNEKRVNFEALHQVRGLKRYYNVFLFYLFLFGLTADALGFILFITLLATN